MDCKNTTFFWITRKNRKKILAEWKKCVILHLKDEGKNNWKAKVTNLFSENNFYFQFSVFDSKILPWWWNGRHGRLKICCSQGREGSSPSRGTKERWISALFFLHTTIIVIVKVARQPIPSRRCEGTAGGRPDSETENKKRSGGVSHLIINTRQGV